MKRLSNKQLDVMNVLWHSESPLSIYEIVENNPSLNIHTVQTVIKVLLFNDFIKVADYTYSGTVISRQYSPIITESEYIDYVFQNKPNVSVLSNLIGRIDDRAVLDDLEKLIEEKKKELDRLDQ